MDHPNSGSAPVPEHGLRDSPASRTGPVRRRIPDGLSSALDDRARELGLPLATLLASAHAAVTAFLSGETEARTGLVTSTGGDPVELRVRLPEHGSWRELVLATATAVRETGRDGQGAGTDPVRHLFGSVLDPYGDDEGAPPRGPALRAVLDREGLGSLSLRLHHDPAVHGAESAERIAGYYLRALERVADGSDRAGFNLIGEEEERLLRSFSGPDGELPDRTLLDEFDLRVRERPQAVALKWGEETLSYAELDAASEGLARQLRHRGVERGTVVTTLLGRGSSWAVGVLAILKTGAVYLPQDVETPVERLASVLRRSQCRHVLVEDVHHVDDGLRALVPGLEPVACAERAQEGAVASAPRPRPSDPAYIIFTSGSTGEPKGALISHRGMLNHLLAKEEDVSAGGGDRIAQTATECFDISVWQLLLAWMYGGTTVIYTKFDQLDVRGFFRSLAADRITLLEVVPSYLDLLLSETERHPVELPDLRAVMVTGEAFPPAYTHRWFSAYPSVPMINAYGPSEAADDVTHHWVREPVHGARVPVGRAIRNAGIHVVGPDGTLRPFGAYGEICVTGPGVGLGYVNDSERTAAVFTKNSLDRRSELMYRTGDLGRWLPGGVLDCAGREDGQVKVRGYRIELSDVDVALSRIPGVETAVTVTREFGGQNRLVAYYAGAEDLGLTRVQKSLSEFLPWYMHPEKVVRVDEFPLTSRGKIDRAALD